MTSSRIWYLAVCSVWLAACAGTNAHVQAGAAGGPPAGSSKDEIARARADSIRHPYTAADVKFMSGMIGHHSQAILMSRMVPERSTNTSIRTLAERIINAQQDEIAIMQRWLGSRRQPVPVANTTDAHAVAGHNMSMPGMQMSGTSTTAALMPGMLSPAQLAQLGAAKGAEFDELFLTFMIQHHSGAITMVKELFGAYGAGQDDTVFKFASDVNVDQTTEIARMERMLFVLRLERKTP